MNDDRLSLLEEWYKNYEIPSVEGHIKELINAIRTLQSKETVKEKGGRDNYGKSQH